jgi:uncharacterized SAM-binding protein YcdF (DUF218 family)
MTWLTWALVRRVAIVVGLILFGYYLITFVQVWSAAGDDNQNKSDAIIVLGAAQYNGTPSRVFGARLDHAAALYKQGVAPTIVVTGGKQPGDQFTEAAAGAEYLHTKGVPDADILREVDSHSSVESLQASARFLPERGITSVVLVSDPFHSLRVRLIAEELGLIAVTSPTRSSPITGLDEKVRFASEALRVAVGRIFGFERSQRVGKLVPGLAILASVGGGVIGNTAGSGPVVEGSSPSPRALRRRRVKARRVGSGPVV